MVLYINDARARIYVVSGIRRVFSEEYDLKQLVKINAVASKEAGSKIEAKQ